MILMLWHGVKIIIAEAVLCEPHQRGTSAEAQSFMARARLLPFVHKAHLQGEERSWNARYNKARELIVACSPACQGFLWLLDERKLPFSVAIEVMAFEGSA